jgi:hypothetical protein
VPRNIFSTSIIIAAFPDEDPRVFSNLFKHSLALRTMSFKLLSVEMVLQLAWNWTSSWG